MEKLIDLDKLSKMKKPALATTGFLVAGVVAIKFFDVAVKFFDVLKDCID